MWNIILDFDGRFWCTDALFRESDNFFMYFYFAESPSLVVVT